MSRYPVVIIAQGIGVPRGIDDGRRRHASFLASESSIRANLDGDDGTNRRDACANRTLRKEAGSNETGQ